MKKIVYSFIAVILILSLIVYCKCENGEEKKSPIFTYTDVEVTLDRDGIEISRDELVVRFPEDMPEFEKEKLRDSGFAISDATKKCSCGNNPIELWKIDTTKITVEEAKSKTVSNSGRGGVNGDHQFYFKVPDSSSIEPRGGPFITYDEMRVNVLDPFVVPPAAMGPRVNIAIVDTGYDFGGNQPLPFLYSSEREGFNCLDHTAGWNFVEGSADIRDDHSNGHGTLVSKMLMRELDDHNIPYSILPVKAFDGKGKGSYWNIICAMNYIKEIQAQNGKLHIVNASFGYDFHKIEDIAKRDTLIKFQKEGLLAALIDDLNIKNTIIVASAGNDNLNTDEPGHTHFPSGFIASNLIGVGGYIQKQSVLNLITKTIAGNYGSVSIDLAAPYQIRFDDTQDNGVQGIGEGTSFGTPVVTAKLAQFINSGTGDDSTLQVISNFLTSQYVKIEPSFEQKIGNGRYTISDYPNIIDMRPDSEVEIPEVMGDNE